MSEQGAREQPDLARASDPIRMRRQRSRNRCVSSLRAWAASQGLEEMITPILCPEPSGASASPFWTHSSAAARALALRVAPENALARLVCSGWPAVYEIGPSFRNEGFSRRHHPEFLMIEAYRVDWTWRQACSQAMACVELCLSAMGDCRPIHWQELDCWQALLAFGYAGELDEEALRGWLAEREPAGADALPPGPDELAWRCLEHLEPPRDGFFMLRGHPESMSPLAATDPDRPGSCQRFELFASGMEIANGYAQLADLSTQADRFARQARLAGAGFEAMGADHAYLDAMSSLGMPSFSGFGIGIDRLCMIASNCSIREMLPFPLTGS